MKKKKESVLENTQFLKDVQTVTSEGVSVKPRIEGINIRSQVTLEDKRGELFEVYNLLWEFHPDPLVYVYQAIIRPGAIRGWVVHEEQDDRIFVSIGVLRWVLYDNRPTSPTYKLLNEFIFSEKNRTLFNIPKGVVHAAQNIGNSDALFTNMPTKPYRHENPDKYRLPLKNDIVPFDFDQAPGW